MTFTRTITPLPAVAWLLPAISWLLPAQSPQPACVQPLCVTRTDDDANNPLPGMLRYAINKAPSGAVITFDASLHRKVIELDRGSPANHLLVKHDLSIEGPGPELLTISGGKATRIFFISSGTVQISGLTLADGMAKGGDGGAASGGAGGGGGGAGLGGAIFLRHGSLMLNSVVLSGNRAMGGSGGAAGRSVNAGRGGGGGGFSGNSIKPASGGRGGDLETTDEQNGGIGGPGGAGGAAAYDGGEGGWGAGGGGGGVSFQDGVGRGAMGGPSGFAGGVGGAGGYFDAETGNEIPGAGGCGGSGLGGALFVRSGLVHMNDTAFLNNGSAAGAGASGALGGIAKGGAIFICSTSYCGSGNDGIVVLSGKMVFKGNSAGDAGVDEKCPGRDDGDVCGPLNAFLHANESRL